jgi:hypothetical protein
MIHPCHAQGLGSWDQVSCYCERAFNPDFWAEPLNALTNLAFLFAALFAYVDLRAKGPGRGTGALLVLIGLLMTVGAGSFLFHTYATAWSRLADVTPISLLITLFMVLALRWFLHMSIWSSVAISGVVVGVTVVMFLCGGLLPDSLCTLLSASLSGSLAYAPALIALAVIGTILHWRKHGATDWVLSAMCVFSASLIFRTLDGWPAGQPLGCMVREMGERTVALGTHSLWHILNAVTLYLLLRALIENAPASRNA